MKQFTKALFILFLLGTASLTMGFSLIGPFKNGATPNDWQARGFGGRPAGLGYTLDFDIGGPMFPLEGYRWNLPIITYGFDESFVRYFGPQGMAAVSNAFQILMDLPPFTSMSPDLAEFNMDIKGQNFQAQTLGLLDVQSETLAHLLEELGLANPQRFVWGLKSRVTPPMQTNYATIMLNYDPATRQSTRYVNGVLYGYHIFDAIGPMGGEWASAVETLPMGIDPFYLPYSAVAGAGFNRDLELLNTLTSFSFSQLAPGYYFPGLTRDDIGGLRYLYGTNNMVTELLLTTNFSGFITGGQVSGNAGSPWQTFFSNTNVFIGATNAVFNTNAAATNGLIVQGLRPGVNKFIFKRIDFDSLLGQTLIPVTNKYTDTIITNGRPMIQPLLRTSVQPDILFLVEDVGIDVDGIPFIINRTGTGNWQNNDPINGYSNLGGPGVIAPQVRITFTDVLPYFLNFQPDFLDDLSGSGEFVWGSFDGSTNAPIIYPAYLNITVKDLENSVLGNGH